MFLAAEMMLQGVSVSFVAWGRYHNDWGGQILVIFILTVAACEAAIALALVLALYQRSGSLDIAIWQHTARREPADLSSIWKLPEAADDPPVWPESDACRHRARASTARRRRTAAMLSPRYVDGSDSGACPWRPHLHGDLWQARARAQRPLCRRSLALSLAFVCSLVRVVRGAPAGGRHGSSLVAEHDAAAPRPAALGRLGAHGQSVALAARRQRVGHAAGRGRDRPRGRSADQAAGARCPSTSTSPARRSADGDHALRW